MSSEIMNLVHEFHRTFGLTINEPNHSPYLRMQLLNEEHSELQIAFRKGMAPTLEGEIVRNRAEIIKEMADLAYVLYGTAIAFGIDLDEAVRRVHHSNMTKLNENGEPIYRADGKILKSTAYKEPDLDDL